MSRAVVEAVEQRRLLAATVSGTVFADVNCNGVQESGDAGVSGKIVFGDYNYNGVLEAGEPRTTTAADGRYSLTGVKDDFTSVGVRLANTPADDVAKPSGGIYAARYRSGEVRGNINFALKAATSPARTVTLRGRAFADFNFDGAFTAFDRTSATIIYADLNGDGGFDAGEPTAATAADGTYTLAGVPANTTVGIGVRNLSNPRPVATGSPGTTADGVDLPITPTYIETRFAPFADTNGNGSREAGEPFEPLLDLWLDANKNGLRDPGEQVGQLAPDGRSYVVRVTSVGERNPPDTIVLRRQGDADASADRTYDVRYNAPDEEPYDFSIALVPRLGNATVRGTVFGDLDQDGVRDANENGIGGKTVFGDYDYDGVLDTNEPRTTTAADGTYVLTGIKSDFSSVAVRLLDTATADVVKPTGGAYWARYNPGDDRSNYNFALKATVTPEPTIVSVAISPRLVNADAEAFFRFGGGPKAFWLDADFDGLRDADEPLLEPDRFWVSGGGSFPLYKFNVAANATYQIGAAASDAVGASAIATLRTTAPAEQQPSQSAVTFIVPAVGTTYLGFLYDDQNRNGLFDEGQETPGLLAERQVAVFADYDGDFIHDADEPVAQPFHDDTFTTYNGYFAFRDLRPGQAFTVRPLNFQPGIRAIGGTSVSGVGVNEFRRGPGVGYTFTDIPGSAAAVGAVFGDANGNGQRDNGETFVPGFAVHADLDGDGVIDPSEPVSQPVGTEGFYGIYNLPDDRPTTLRLIGSNPDWTPTRTTQVVDPTPGSTVEGVNFGLQRKTAATATVRGSVFGDVNQNGVKDAGERGVAGKTVFADYNYNGVLEANEPRATTAADGSYTLAGIKADFSSVPIRLADTATASVLKPGGGAYWARYNPGDSRVGYDFAIA